MLDELKSNRSAMLPTQKLGFGISPYFVANLVAFQAVWAGCVIGAGAFDMHALAWLPTIALLLLTVRSPVARIDLYLALFAILVGWSLDSLWIFLGILDFTHTSGSFAPYWIALLWLGLGQTINHSMVWFRDKGLLGAAIVGLFAPVTYLSGERLGAVNVEQIHLLPVICLSWFILFAGLSATARRFCHDAEC